MNRIGLVFIVLVLGGCFAPDSFTDEMPDDLPAGQCEDTDTDACVTGSSSSASATGGATSTSTSTGAPDDACQGSDGCQGNDSCVAAWDPEAEARGAFACQFACVPLLDETAWCSDDASCCETGAVCTSRGYCVLNDRGGGS